MTIAIFTIGTEITRGEIHNTNTGWLAEKLTENGHLVTEMVSVDDDDQALDRTLNRLCAHHEIVICTGGLGPTTDDRTRNSAARVAQVNLVKDEDSFCELKRYLSQKNRPLTPSNKAQVYFPTGSLVLKNHQGTAPGFSLSIKKSQAYFLPGVPQEMRPLFLESVLPNLPSVQNPLACIRIHTYGLPEAQLSDLLKDLDSVTIGYRAANSYVEVKVLAHGKDHPSALHSAEKVAQIIEERLGSHAYARDNISLPGHVGELLQAQGLSLGLAESCTGGLVSSLITRLAGASRYYNGAICSYQNDVKERLLFVSPETLKKYGAVSQQVAKEMALGARKALACDISLALTGIAGPTGASAEKPVGLVHWAISYKDQLLVKEGVFRGSRKEIQDRAAMAGLWSLRTALYD